MSTTTTVKYLGGSASVYVVDAAAEVDRGGTLDVAADVAGQEPGPWIPRTVDTPEHWPSRLADDGSTVEVRDPGSGLLAQTDLWARVTPAPARTTTTKTGA